MVDGANSIWRRLIRITLLLCWEPFQENLSKSATFFHRQSSVLSPQKKNEIRRDSNPLPHPRSKNWRLRPLGHRRPTRHRLFILFQNSNLIPLETYFQTDDEGKAWDFIISIFLRMCKTAFLIKYDLLDLNIKFIFLMCLSGRDFVISSPISFRPVAYAHTHSACRIIKDLLFLHNAHSRPTFYEI